MIERVRCAEIWNRQKPETLKRLPSTSSYSRDVILAGLDRRSLSEEEFERFRFECVRQYRKELDRLRQREQSRHRRVTGWDIERQITFAHLHIRPKATRNPFHGIGRNVEDKLDREQLSFVYGLLLDLLDHVPWKGIDGEELWRRVCHNTPVT
ncbi:MAG: hypothetical protein WCE79_13180 [Xanthobacteraceae bacterium]